MRFLALLILAIPLTLVAVIVLAILAPMLRLVGRLIASGLAALVATILPLGPERWWVPLAVFVVTFLLLGRGRQRRRAAPAAARVIDQPAVPPEPAVPGWGELRALADWRTRRRLDAARDSFARYLAQAEQGEDPAAQLPIKLTRHVPDMVADCVRHCRTATPDERRQLVGDTTATLELLAVRAEERRRELAHHAQGGFRTLKTHLSNPDD